MYSAFLRILIIQNIYKSLKAETPKQSRKGIYSLAVIKASCS